jgi:hypothetical protein
MVRAAQVAACRAVAGQLERFGDGMRADSEAQRAVMRGLLREEAQRAEAAVGEVLQLSNAGGLGAYVFGAKGKAAKDLPVARVPLHHCCCRADRCLAFVHWC